MRAPSLPLLAMLLPLAALPQEQVRGRVVDSRTDEPLAFVHVLAEGQGQGATSDIEGRFAVPVGALPAQLRFSYVGYAPLELVAERADAGVVRMERTAIALPEAVVRPGENPAHRIIALCRANRKQNDGLRNRPHRYTSYSKTVITADADSALGADTVAGAGGAGMDRWLSRHHLLLVESATRRTFIPPDREKEEVLAMRVSGLQDPSMLALLASTRTFSMYAPQIEINERTYLGPLGPGSTDRYLFQLQDTLYAGRDTVFAISYQPRHGRRFDALKGVLWVNSDGYALQNAIAEPVERAGGIGVKLQQQHARVNGAWFPVQLSTFLLFDRLEVNGRRVVGVSHAYLRGIELDAPIAPREVRGPELIMDRLAARHDEAFWAALRTDTLTAKERLTYAAIDSLSRAEGLERRLSRIERLMTGRLPLGPIDLRLDQLLRYNGHEGLRAGAGAATNDRVTRYASWGGYAAYGFADKAWKHGADLVIKPRPGIGPELKLYYSLDVAESGGVAFPAQGPGLLEPEGYRWLFVRRMEREERAGAELAWRVNRHLKLWLGTERSDREGPGDYRLAEPAGEGITLLSRRFLTGSVSLAARFAFRERVVRAPGRQLVLPSPWPVVQVRLARAVPGLWGGDRGFLRADAQVEHRFRLRMLGDLSLRAMGGWASREAPLGFLYSPRGTSDPRIPLAAPFTFEAMRPNEFLADRYVAVQARHSFGHLLFKGRRWRPVPVLVGSALWGGLAQPQRHRGAPFTPLQKGYYEAGAQLDRVLASGPTGFGIGAYWRFGPNRLPEPLDNLAVKATLGFTF